jgi:AcrR family transcriptional regulator
MTKSQPNSRSGADGKPYHHGNLVDALIASTIEIIEEQGVEHVSVREAARRAGVSPGAPFRHFKTKAALMTAVAEQAMRRLQQAVTDAVAETAADDPLAAFEAIGRGYLRWALANPTHFQIISSRSLIDFDGSETLRQNNAHLRQLMIGLLAKAQEHGHLRQGLSFDHLVLGARALVYGLARMAIDGHFPEWHRSEAPEQAVQQALRAYVSQIRAEPAAPLAGLEPGKGSNRSPRQP